MRYDSLIDALINVSKERELIIEWNSRFKITGTLDTIFETSNGLDEDDSNYMEYDAAVIKVNNALVPPTDDEGSIYNWLKKEESSLIEISLYDDPPSAIFLANRKRVWEMENHK
ncbi:hypothetical protein QUF88_07785 [Bacillus sp. DX1.1]|uniref:hypothetical protein n=1 Tax=unclassified Bacillus (in: firmicutes) TaxID=185979 RepID=UPI002570BF51|nr:MULTISPECIES: hypothetical protein [unclassified Bacillus (in: firmicutes)]MDM5153728.1 hypothetical protein [Bacillus sp. DX1.1]WJE82665.1 hypothetical protein QRE67_05290 [Bacillus sp. DX3.1]